MSSADHPHSDLIEKYLSGTASEEQVARLETLMREDPAFRELFEAAEAQLGEEFEALEPIEPPPQVLDELLHKIDPGPETAVTQFTPKVQSEPWRTISVISSLAAVVAIGLHLVPAAPTPELGKDVRAVALLDSESDGSLIAFYDASTGQILARVSNLGVSEDQVGELWLIQDGAEAPVSLGLIQKASSEGRLSFNVNYDIQLGKDALAVSIEPLGGSKENGPTGPVVLAGVVDAI